MITHSRSLPGSPSAHLSWQFSSFKFQFTHERSCARGRECASFPKPPPQRPWPEAAAAAVFVLRFRLRGHIWPEEEGGGATQAEAVLGRVFCDPPSLPLPQGSRFRHQGGEKQRSGAGIPLSELEANVCHQIALTVSVEILVRSPQENQGT